MAVLEVDRPSPSLEDPKPHEQKDGHLGPRPGSGSYSATAGAADIGVGDANLATHEAETGVLLRIVDLDPKLVDPPFHVPRPFATRSFADELVFEAVREFRRTHQTWEPAHVTYLLVAQKDPRGQCRAKTT